MAEPTAVDKAQIAALLKKLKEGKPLRPRELEMVRNFQAGLGATTGHQTVDDIRAWRDRAAAKKKHVAAAARDIGPLPEIANVERRRASARNFRIFCEVYFAEVFNLGWSDDHLRVIAKIERSVLDGGLFAMAMPRGSGKSTLAEVASLWAIMFGHRTFVVLIGASEGQAVETLDSLKTELETNDLLLEDFPEVCHPIRALEGIPHRANGQLLDGKRTRIGWTGTEVVFPTVPGSRASSAIIRVAGITGRVRGMKYKRADGASVRPDFVILDDPQTDESSRSPSQSQAREAVLAGAILGLAGPGKKIAGVMPCTVIHPGDMADRILDAQKHPEWNGERTKLVYAWPKAVRLWERYAKIRADNLRENGTIAKATEFYREHQQAMDAGARVAWDARFNPDELSAIQHAWNLRLQDERAFFAEYQNDPLPDEGTSDEELTTDLVAGRLNGMARAALPQDAATLTAFVDVQGKALWWVVCAWASNFTGWVVDYGTFPDQKRHYFTLRDMRVTLAHAIKGAGQEGQIYGGLQKLTAALFARRFHRADGVELSIDRMLIDANWGESTPTVYQFCRESPHSASIFPSHGRYVGASGRPMDEWQKKRGERVGDNWRTTAAKRGLRAILYDTNHWKSFIAARFLAAPGDPGTLTLWGRDPDEHRCLVDHVTAEHRVRTSGRGRQIDEWKLRPGRDNHWWDGLVGCAVGASIQGVSPLVAPGKPLAPKGLPVKRERMSFAALQRAAKERRA